MRILSIETSCDETAISAVDATGEMPDVKFSVLSDVTLSQAKLHAEFGGVFPALAKREHAKNLIPILKKILAESNLSVAKVAKDGPSLFSEGPSLAKVKNILAREPELLEQFLEFIPTIEKPEVDALAVTVGPGLEPALWVGINFAKALSETWKIPVIPVNHMEGHIFAAVLQKVSDSEFSLSKIEFPAIALLISGGHTQLVLIKNLGKYEVIGDTRDDAVGEAFDKVARILGLPYPGGPHVSRLAELSKGFEKQKLSLPRPMLNTNDFDFSFSGLKTAVLYKVRDTANITDDYKACIAKEFQNAVVDVLLRKTFHAVKHYNAKTIIIGGGVSANKQIRNSFKNETLELGKKLLIPSGHLSTDNALMIAVAGFFHAKNTIHVTTTDSIAMGNYSIGDLK